MSQRTDASPTPPNPLPRVEEKPVRSGSWRSSRRFESNDKPGRQTSLRMSEGRESGELEGSTLGNSSRDEDKGGRGSRRTHSSGGFLLDSSFLPRSSSLRHSYHRAHHSESERREKRGTPPDSEIVVPKKRSRFPWSRQKESVKESPAAAPERKVSQETPGPLHSRQDAVPDPSQTTEAGSEAPLGLDRDSLQIVNLALNLSESRRVNTHGRVPSGRVAGGGWAASAGQPSVSPSESRAPLALGSQNDGPYPQRSFSRMPVDDRSKLLGASHVDHAVHAPSSVLNLLPDSANSNSLPHVFSDGTLARAEKARRHFELFSEYLRLLPSLPALRPYEAHADPDSTSGGDGVAVPGRSYNPLQSIRNRKVRFRERCPIDTEAEGWTNVGKVHEWVDLIRDQYNQQDHSTFECLKLPSFHQGSKDVSHKEPEDDEIIAASPSSSLRRASRASSVKARRPKSDWMVSPPELLADVAWVEDIQNKSKLIDKDGNNLYPDPVMLIPSDALKTKTRSIQEELPSRRESVDTDQPTSRTSLSDAHPGLTPEFKRIGRGRRRHRFQGPSHIVRSSGGRHKFRRRSSSSASASSRDDKQYWKYQGESMASPKRSTSQRPDPSRAKRYAAPLDEESSLEMKNMSPQSSSFQRSWKDSDRTKSQEQRESISSAPSVDDRYDRLTSSLTADGRAPLTPIQPTFFPSIASNLSPPSSRSPSPSKGRFPRAIIPRRERSKSNSRPKDAVDNSSLESEVLRNNSLSEYSEGLLRTGRLEPSPLPNQIPSTHQDGRVRSSQQVRKGLAQHESKLRGIFKGPGKIAEKVGNEVSKMGGLILKKDSLAHSRQSSFESHVTSDDENILTDAEESKGDRAPDLKAPLRRLPTFSEDFSLAARGELEKASGKNYLSAPSPFPSPARQGDQSEGHSRSDLGSPQKASSESEMKSTRDTESKDEALLISKQKMPDARKKPQKVPTFGPELHTIREQIKKGRIKDPSVPYSLTRPPITGLAQAKASHEPSSHERRSTSSSQSRSWSISERSVSTSIESGVPAKREVERTRALLLSSGIKAREITRRAHTVRSPPPEFLRRAFGSDMPIPEVPRSHEFDLAIQALVKRFEKSEELFKRSMDGYPGAKTSALRSHLGELEDLVNNSLNPRVRAAAQDAEDLSIQLNTTSTLAVKQLSDTLDKGIRRRHRRLRWIRRTGFVMLEWALVGILWWVWLIVMAFKLLRGVFRGVISGVRWVLWL
ncbi:hypothetical protein BDV38DRAFT_163370 [Aspergillus pseudotamarii]|uniref:Uncharacterized protein n=1 Tax=Aspergillus pseudotamarii TaxID=132259 RepID=A0A5N6SLP9_ASPPS|nr:uncharacterized protein BDV38DRAFT_163370 [Aspergillus pseudotamarii]KAE8134283.1 hypothetical protein BDV38DRAFT_163370 [Aspergillus pseudotamarii]